jgi:hypothetical protein
MMNIKRTAEDAAAGEDPDELYLAENVFWGAEGGAPVAPSGQRQAA